MSVQATTSISTTVATPVATTASTVAAATTTTPATDTVTLSDAAVAAANSSTGTLTTQQFNDLIHQLNNKINSYEHQVTFQLDHGQAVTLPLGVTASNSNASTGATSPATIADGFAGLEANLQTQLTNLTLDQQTQVTSQQAKFATEQARFQKFADNRAAGDLHTAPKYNAVTRLLKTKVNAYEHQVTYQIDHGTAITKPVGLAAEDTGTAASTAAATTSATTETTADTTSKTAAATTTDAQNIANGFASLESSFGAKIADLPMQFGTQFQALQATLTTELQRFTAFAAQRSASRASSIATGITQDVDA